jgi:hypothetical protein
MYKKIQFLNNLNIYLIDYVDVTFGHIQPDSIRMITPFFEIVIKSFLWGLFTKFEVENYKAERTGYLEYKYSSKNVESKKFILPTFLAKEIINQINSKVEQSNIQKEIGAIKYEEEEEYIDEDSKFLLKEITKEYLIDLNKDRYIKCLDCIKYYIEDNFLTLDEMLLTEYRVVEGGMLIKGTISLGALEQPNPQRYIYVDCWNRNPYNNLLEDQGELFSLNFYYSNIDYTIKDWRLAKDSNHRVDPNLIEIDDFGDVYTKTDFSVKKYFSCSHNNLSQLYSEPEKYIFNGLSFGGFDKLNAQINRDKEPRFMTTGNRVICGMINGVSNHLEEPKEKENTDIFSWMGGCQITNKSYKKVYKNISKSNYLGMFENLEMNKNIRELYQ